MKKNKNKDLQKSIISTDNQILNHFFDKKVLFSILIISIITFISFYPSLQNDFTGWDDPVYVNDNNVIKDFSPEGIFKIFTITYANFYHPITLLSYAVEYHFFKLSPFIYHLTNFIFHLLNTLLVFWIFFIVTNNIYPSGITAILFGIHPLHVESVAWISERKDVLSTFFIFLTIILYLFYSIKLDKKYYYLSLFIFIISLLSKPMGITIPFVLILFDYLQNRKLDKKAILEKIPYLLLAILFLSITMICFSKTLSVKTSFITNILVACHGLIFYLFKMVVPVNLSNLYPSPKEEILSSPVFILSPIAVTVITVAILYVRKYSKKIVFAFLFYLITILPVIQLIRNTDEIAADRYTYITLTGIFYLIGETFSWLYFKKYAHSKYIKGFIAGILIFIIITFSYLTWERCKVWHDSITLWEDVLKKYTHNSKPYFSLATEYGMKSENDKAIEYFNYGLKLDPTSADAYVNRGNVYRLKEQYDKAANDYLKALSMDDKNYKAYNNLGIIYQYGGEYNKAIELYSKAIEIKKDYEEAYFGRGVIYLMQNNYQDGMADLNRAITIDPDYSEAYNSRGVACCKADLYDKAILDFNKAIEIDNKYSDAYYNRGNAYSSLKQYDNAIEDYTKSISIKPDEYTYLSRGDVYKSSGQFNKAMDDYNKAIELKPDNLDNYNKRAELFFLIKDYDNAWKDVKKLQVKGYPLNPEFMEALNKASKGEKHL